MNGLSFRQALAQRDVLFGTAVVCSSPQVVPVVADLGLDYVFIDTEHIPIDRRTLAWMCQAYEGRQIAPLVRIPAPDPYQASFVLHLADILAFRFAMQKDLKALRRTAGVAVRQTGGSSLI